MEGTALELRAIDRLSQTLVHVQPPLEAVSTSQHLRAWADAVIDRVAVELDAQSAVERVTPVVVGNPHEEAIPCRAAGSVGLQAWEHALSQALSRLQSTGSLSCAVNTTTLGSAFAALLYGGLLLGQATGDALPLRAAMDMALSQVEGHPRTDRDRNP
jgi:hypothetical protein